MYYCDFWRCPRAGLPTLLLSFILALTGSVSTAAAPGDQSLSLADAIAQALAQNPTLQVFDTRLTGLEGQQITAQQSPALELGFEAENILGAGDYERLDQAEYTLSLSSVLELGDKRLARANVISGRYALVSAQRQAEALGLAGDITRQFISALALQEKLQLADEAVELTQSTLASVKHRAEQGAAHRAELLRARVQVTESQLARDQLRASYESNLMALAALLGKDSVDFSHIDGSLFTFTTPASFESLFQRASNNPGIRVFASEASMRDAELALVRSQSRSNVRWQVGARYFEDSGDSALVAGFSIPLFPGDRNRGELQSAQAARAAITLRRDSALLELRSRLYEAYQLHNQAVTMANALSDQVVPDLQQALALTRTAYQQGRYSYFEWLSAQQELLAAQRNRVDAATTALLNQALIEQLTGESLAATAN